MALLLLLTTVIPLVAAEPGWNPVRDATRDGKPLEDLTINGRPYEVFQHGVKPEWGYQAPQQDTFVLVHPKQDRKNAPLYVVLHSAGHDVIQCVKCTRDVGNHDIYRSPEDFYALYLDCRRNPNDWWWGGMHLNDANLTQKNSGGDPMPVERRVMDTVRWVIQQYGIDANRVYLTGISMGGSGTLGIGMRNGDVFAAIKASIPAGIEHVSNRMYFPPQVLPEAARIPDPPIAIDESAQNDNWSSGHERFAQAMNDRRYALFLNWGPFDHAHNHLLIEKTNDLVNSFDWLNVKKNEAYPVFSHATSNDKLPWPADLKSTAAGQINAFFRWKCLSDTNDRLAMALFLVSPSGLKTTFKIPGESTADVSLRRIQNGPFKPGACFHWTYGTATGEGKADASGLITIPGLKISSEPTTLTVSKSRPRFAIINNIEPRRDIHGEIIDAHDGCLEYFEGRYYLYGVRFGNGDGFGNTNRFVCYSSPDMQAWTPHGEMVKELNVNPRTYFQCYVKFNKRSGKYVMWYNAAGENGVAVADRPEGPFILKDRNVKLKHSASGVGDISLFIDDDDTCYLLSSIDTTTGFKVKEEPIPHHQICVEKLTPDYLGTTGEATAFVAGNCEGPSMFKRNNSYYLLSDNTCCYCPDGTGVRVYTAATAMGPFTYRGNINLKADNPRDLPSPWTPPGTGRADSIIKAQGKHVAAVPTPGGMAFLWIGDRWSTRPDGLKGHDFQYWSSPLQFESDGMLQQMKWEDQWMLELPPPPQ